MRVDQKTIAERLNLSPATVCRSLQSHPSVGPETRARVASMAAQLGYRSRSSIARSPSRDLRQIGFLVIGQERLANPFHRVVSSRLLQGMAEEARRAHVAMQVLYVPNEDAEKIDDPAFQPAAMREGILDGLIVEGFFSKRIVAALAATVPCVRIVHRDYDLPLDCMDQNNVQAVEQLVGHLHQLGHRQIGLLGNQQRVTWMRSRLAGYVEAISAQGLPFDMANVVNVIGASLPRVDAHRLVLERIRAGVTAWVCAVDAEGYPLIPFLEGQGLRVPSDVSVCGFDNLEPPNGLPKLTTIESPFEEMGAGALRRVLARIQSPAMPPVHLQFGCRMIPGQTTGAVLE